MGMEPNYGPNRHRPVPLEVLEVLEVLVKGV